MGVLDFLFDQGKDERNAAKSATRQAASGWGNVLTNLPDISQLAMNPNNLAYYEEGAPLEAATIEDRSATIQGDPTGRAMQEGAGAYYAGVAADDSPLDPYARGMQEGAANYFGNIALNGGLDAVAEAEYQRRRREAEQDARSKREAALQAAEMRGEGGGGARLLADLTGGQQAATATNMAGMQAAADMQTRRDSAATSAADIGSTLHGQTFDEAGRRDDAAAKYGDMGTTMREAGLDETQARFDAFYDTATANQDAANYAAEQNWNRSNDVSDANVDVTNEAIWSYPKAVQQNFDNLVTGTSGWGNALLGRANILQDFSAGRQNWIDPDKTWEAAGNVAKAKMGGGKT